MSDAVGISKIEFLLILISIVYGFCVVDLFENWGRMLRRNVYYWETTTWSIILFLGIAFLWYNAWTNLARIVEGALHYVMALLPSICFFLLTSLLFPDKHSDVTLQLTFHKNKKRFFITLAVVIAMVIAISYITGSPKGFVTLSRSFFLVAVLTLAFVDKKELRLAVAILAFLWFGFLLSDPYA